MISYEKYVLPVPMLVMVDVIFVWTGNWEDLVFFFDQKDLVTLLIQGTEDDVVNLFHSNELADSIIYSVPYKSHVKIPKFWVHS